MGAWRIEDFQLVLSRNKVAVGEPVAEKITHTKACEPV